MKHLFARAAVFAALASAVLLGGLPAQAATAHASTAVATSGSDGLMGWWEKLWFGEDKGGLFSNL